MAAVDAFGTVWAISTDGGTVYTPVADVVEVGVLDTQVDTIETTTHGSAGQWRTFMGGMKDGGELKMSVNYDPALHGTIWSAMAVDGTKHRVTLTDAGAAVVDFTGIITGLSLASPYDDKLAADVTIKVSGAPVITP